jgi:choline-phosphate cytidylyltransferase
MDSKESTNFTIPDGKDPNNPVRIYTDGIFDCFHYGHALLLKQIKDMFKYVYLIVGVCSDEDTTREKGLTIMTEKERAECVRHCKWVDEVYDDGPWIPTLEFIDKLNCHYIAHDPIPYPVGNIPDVYGVFKENNRFLATRRTDGISTTDIMIRVIRNYDLYLLRNIKKGATAQELNINSSKYFLLKISIIFDKIYSNKNHVRDLNKFLIFFFRKWRNFV